MLGDKLFTEKIAKGAGFISVGGKQKGNFKLTPKLKTSESGSTLAGNKSNPTKSNQNAPQGTEGHQKALPASNSKIEKIDTNVAPIVSGGNNK